MKFFLTIEMECSIADMGPLLSRTTAWRTNVVKRLNSSPSRMPAGFGADWKKKYTSCKSAIAQRPYIKQLLAALNPWESVPRTLAAVSPSEMKMFTRIQSKKSADRTPAPKGRNIVPELVGMASSSDCGLAERRNGREAKRKMRSVMKNARNLEGFDRKEKPA